MLWYSGKQRNTAVWSTVVTIHAHQAVVCVCSSSADHAHAPVEVLGERALASLVIHNGHRYTLQLLMWLICFQEQKGGLLLNIQTTNISPESVTCSHCDIFSTTTHQSTTHSLTKASFLPLFRSMDYFPFLCITTSCTGALRSEPWVNTIFKVYVF